METKALWKPMIDCKYGSLWGGWCTKEVNGASGVGIWKHIRLGWGDFISHSKLVLGKGSCIKFWEDIWCGNKALKDAFPAVFRVAHNQEASIEDLMLISGDQMQWNITFSRAA